MIDEKTVAARFGSGATAPFIAIVAAVVFGVFWVAVATADAALFSIAILPPTSTPLQAITDRFDVQAPRVTRFTGVVFIAGIFGAMTLLDTCLFAIVILPVTSRIAHTFIVCFLTVAPFVSLAIVKDSIDGMLLTVSWAGWGIWVVSAFSIPTSFVEVVFFTWTLHTVKDCPGTSVPVLVRRETADACILIVDRRVKTTFLACHHHGHKPAE